MAKWLFMVVYIPSNFLGDMGHLNPGKIPSFVASTISEILKETGNVALANNSSNTACQENSDSSR
jgi:hypothetical protein